LDSVSSALFRSRSISVDAGYTLHDRSLSATSSSGSLGFVNGEAEDGDSSAHVTMGDQNLTNGSTATFCSVPVTMKAPIISQLATPRPRAGFDLAVRIHQVSYVLLAARLAGPGRRALRLLNH
jgi:hypothetical protein